MSVYVFIFRRVYILHCFYTNATTCFILKTMITEVFFVSELQLWSLGMFKKPMYSIFQGTIIVKKVILSAFSIYFQDSNGQQVIPWTTIDDWNIHLWFHQFVFNKNRSNSYCVQPFLCIIHQLHTLLFSLCLHMVAHSEQFIGAFKQPLYSTWNNSALLWSSPNYKGYFMNSLTVPCLRGLYNHWIDSLEW